MTLSVNSSAVITASVFFILSVAMLLFLIFGKSPLSSGIYKNFYRASCGVYVSGTALILVFTLMLKGLPLAFVLISEGMILFVFIFTLFIICFMTRSVVEADKNKKIGKSDDDSEEQERSV
ncbi:MAG: hypothetical protein K5665_11400 [Saccharofermentans sp.]|nr:hypothetical protein [Saccharofermentans sp.]